jgi:hypothetical protein
MHDPLLDPNSYRILPNHEVRCILPGYVSFGGQVLADAKAAGVIV